MEPRTSDGQTLVCQFSETRFFAVIRRRLMFIERTAAVAAGGFKKFVNSGKTELL